MRDVMTAWQMRVIALDVHKQFLKSAVLFSLLYGDSSLFVESKRERRGQTKATIHNLYSIIQYIQYRRFPVFCTVIMMTFATCYSLPDWYCIVIRCPQCVCVCVRCQVSGLRLCFAGLTLGSNFCTRLPLPRWLVVFWRVDLSHIHVCGFASYSTLYTIYRRPYCRL